ncbi:MAG: hypothetical protein HZA52_07550 [Planctomycetes bacterium]|nr:hypothetical protein [Planctomycetota bacterium]
MPKTIERTRRSPEQRIADLQAKIEAIKTKAERAKAVSVRRTFRLPTNRPPSGWSSSKVPR